MLNVYLNKLNSLLDKTPELAMVLFSPALQTQVLSIAQNCIQRIPDGNATILETLRELTRSIMKELEQSVSILSFDPQRMGSYEGLLNMVISSNVLAVGNPCRVLRTITEADRAKYISE